MFSKINLAKQDKIHNDNKFGIDCLLFERCNLKCKFCLEEHSNNNIDYDYIRKIPYDIVDRMKEEIKTHKDIKEVNIRLWGGELFFDALPDTLFDEYKLLVDNFRKLFRKDLNDVNVTFSWISNGVFTKWERVKDIIEYSNGFIGFSYDPIDRYSSDTQKEMFFKTVEYFYNNDLLSDISITLTKRTINCYISGNSDIEKLRKYKKFDVNFYIPNKNWEELMPTDDDIFNFFKWALDNRLFGIYDIEKLVMTSMNTSKTIGRTCNCDKHLSHCKNCVTYNCVKSSTIFGNDMFYANETQNITEDSVSNIKASLGILKRGCLTCKYYGSCSMPCWTSILFKHYKISECPYKKAHDYITNNKHIIEKYNEYKKS